MSPARREPRQVAAFASEWVAAFTSELVAGFVGIRMPLDMNVLKALRSPFQMDIYAWLSLRSLRTLRLKRPEPVPWGVLKQMFGSDYAELRQFRFAFLQALQMVAKVYPMPANSKSKPPALPGDSQSLTIPGLWEGERASRLGADRSYARDGRRPIYHGQG